MAAIGGSIEAVTLDGRNFPATGDADVNRKLGGFENEVQSNGDGGGRIIKTRMPWSLSGVALECDDARGDQEYLQDLADRNDDFAITITYASGLVYQGAGQIVSELQATSQSATQTVDLSGPGKLTQQ